MRRVFSGNRFLLPDSHEPVPATITVDISTGKITDVQHNVRRDKADFPDLLHPVNFVDTGDRLVIPGIVDAHVHLNEPGRTEWEGFYTGTRAAASGGITTLIDMPLNSIPPTTTVANLEEKRRAARDQCWVDIGFWGGIIPGNKAHLKPLVEAGVKGFKCFLIESGVNEFPCVNQRDVMEAMSELLETSTVICFHAELEDPFLTPPTPPTPPTSPPDPANYFTFLSSRPPSLEVAAIELITRLHRKYPKLRLHVVHLSSAHALDVVREAKAEGLPLTVETCFHYLTLSSPSPSASPNPSSLPQTLKKTSTIPHSHHPEYKCCPPIRSKDNQDELWEALLDSTSDSKNGNGKHVPLIDFVVSDHSPCTPELKKMEEGDMMGAWGGISTLGLGLSLLWTELKRRAGGGEDNLEGEGKLVEKVVKWLCERTARHAGLEGSKGKLAVGFDADLVVWDPEREFEVTKDLLHFKNKVTPYEGLVLSGVVEQTYLRGNLVYDHDKGFSEEPRGEFV